MKTIQHTWEEVRDELEAERFFRQQKVLATVLIILVALVIIL